MRSDMQTFSRHDLTDLFRSLAERMAAEQSYLAELDGEIGDADHGVAMAGGFAAAARALGEAGEADQTLAQGLTLAASSLHNAVGATTGPLYASALLRAASALGAETQVPLSRLPEVIVAMAEGIAARGQGKPGDKTMVDAWAPAAHAARAGLQAGQPAAEVL
ncbi:DAK2 domain-containing protein, partial [Paracoccus marcusii]